MAAERVSALEATKIEACEKAEKAREEADQAQTATANAFFSKVVANRSHTSHF